MQIKRASLLGTGISAINCKAVIFNKTDDILAEEYVKHFLTYPKPDWVKLDPNLVFFNIKKL
jgi:sugar (pentulose or hexulose) kinase